MASRSLKKRAQASRKRTSSARTTRANRGAPELTLGANVSSPYVEPIEPFETNQLIPVQIKPDPVKPVQMVQPPGLLKPTSYYASTTVYYRTLDIAVKFMT